MDDSSTALLKTLRQELLTLSEENSALRWQVKELEAKLEAIRDASAVLLGTISLQSILQNYQEKLSVAVNNLSEALAAKEGK